MSNYREGRQCASSARGSRRGMHRGKIPPPSLGSRQRPPPYPACFTPPTCEACIGIHGPAGGVEWQRGAEGGCRA